MISIMIIPTIFINIYIYIYLHNQIYFESIIIMKIYNVFISKFRDLFKTVTFVI